MDYVNSTAASETLGKIIENKSTADKKLVAAVFTHTWNKTRVGY